jgi:O-acetyl-ADP-ribose deacetylase (regulator of RNase III)
MVEFRAGDIFAADVEALVNAVNCVGVMGRGIALQFRKAFPDNFEAYSAACRRGEVQPGRMFVFNTGQLGSPRYIVNFPTKRHWREKSRVADIDAGLVSLVAEVTRLAVQSIAVPSLGCGLGGLDWSDVRPRIEQALRSVSNLQAIVFEPSPSADTRRVSRSV